MLGAPFDLPDEAETDRLTLELEDRINAITATADACFGHPPDDAEQRYGIIKENAEMIYRLLTTDQTSSCPPILAGAAGAARKNPTPPRTHGRATQKRPPGRVIWLHAASVGETVSALVLASSLLNQDEGATVRSPRGQ